MGGMDLYMTRLIAMDPLDSISNSNKSYLK
jgi:hypothetical protein